MAFSGVGFKLLAGRSAAVARAAFGGRSGPGAAAARAALALALLAAGLLGHAPGAWAATEVPGDWPAKPAELQIGDKFRLLFVTDTRSAADATIGVDPVIDVYNNRIKSSVASITSSHGPAARAIYPFRVGFRVVGCTADADARDNTSTTYTSSSRGHPIYWVNGAKVADDYEDFYDGGWDNETLRATNSDD